MYLANEPSPQRLRWWTRGFPVVRGTPNPTAMAGSRDMDLPSVRPILGGGAWTPVYASNTWNTAASAITGASVPRYLQQARGSIGAAASASRDRGARGSENTQGDAFRRGIHGRPSKGRPPNRTILGGTMYTHPKRFPLLAACLLRSLFRSLPCPAEIANFLKAWWIFWKVC